MRKGFRLGNVLTGKTICSLALSFLAIQSNAQQLPLHIGQFVLFGGSGNCPAPNQTTPPSPGCGVQLGTSTLITGGKIGSYNLVTTTGNSQINADIRSNRLVLSNSNTITGTIAVGNGSSTTSTIFTAGSNFSASSNIFVNGSSSVGGGSISGFLKHPTGTTYSGPAPAGGNIIGDPQLQNFPLMPAITVFPAAGSTNISSNQTINPGNYGQVTLGGGKTLTLNGPGTYVFSKIKNTGNNNKFIFNFQNNATGIFRIYVHGDVDLYKLNVELQNGGSASRIFMEVHGNGSTSPNGSYAWMIANGASGGNQSTWYGTVWAPYAGIDVGSGSSPSKVIGALWSGTQVVLENGVGVTFAMFDGCQAPNANAGPDKFTDCDHPTTQLNGSSTTPNAIFNWSAVNGSFTSSLPSPTVTGGGTFVLTVYGSECYVPATDTAIVNFMPCVLPYYPPRPEGKVNKKIGSELTSLFKTDSANGNTADTSQVIYRLRPGKVLIDIISNSGQTAFLKSFLMTPTFGLEDTISNGPKSLIITGWFPISKLTLLDTFSKINYVRPSFPAINNVNSWGLVRSQGDSAMKTGIVREAYNVTGDGVKIGVISDSYNNLLGAQNNMETGDLPGLGSPQDTVQVLRDYNLGIRTDEGRAMLQIVHDIAPKSKLAFRTGFLTPGDFALGIRQMADSGCKVIVDDITYITEPFFRRGVVDSSIKAVRDSGVSYVTAAGNFGIKSYESIFRPAAPPAGLTGRAHNFRLDSIDIFQNDSIKGTVLKPGIYTIALQWDDDIYSQGGSAGTVNDLDIYLTDDNGVTLFGFNRNNIGGDPIEILPFTVTDTTTTNILIVNASASPTSLTSTVRFKFVVFRGDLKINEYNQGVSTIVGHGNSPDAITVGAALYANTPPYGVAPPTIASFSSRGGPNKPDIVGPNVVNTTFFGSVDYEGDGFQNFVGTSAAAPHIAAAIALLKEAKQTFYSATLSPDDAKSLLLNNAIDMDLPGRDSISGYGFVDVDSAMRAIANPTPIITGLELADSTLVPGQDSLELIVKGKYFLASSKVLFGADTLATVVTNSTEVSAIIPPFTGEQFVRVYNPAKFPNGLDGGPSDSVSITAVPKMLVEVIAKPQRKKYGEVLPTLTDTAYVVMVDHDSLQHTSLTLADLGLTNINYTTNANPFSFVTGLFQYYIRPTRTFDPNIPADAALLNRYNYVFTDGVLTIEKLKVSVTPIDDTLIYGEPIGNVQFRYQYDSTANIADPAKLMDTIALTHQTLLANNVIGLINGNAVAVVNGNAVAVVNGTPVSFDANGHMTVQINGNAVAVVNSQSIQVVNGNAVAVVNALEDSVVEKTGFMVSQASVQNARAIVNTRIVNGMPVTTTTNVIDVTQESILDFHKNPNTTELLTSVSQTHTRGVVSASSILNGNAVAVVNGNAVAVVNGNAVAVVNGNAVAVVNGNPVPIGNSLNSTTNSTATIIDANDTLPGGVNHLKSINMITGITCGEQTVIPGALLDDNLEIVYNLGRYTIVPAPVTIMAKDSTKTYGQQLTFDSTRFTITTGSMQFGESIAKIGMSSTGAAASANAGQHPIIASTAIGAPGTDTANYRFTYLNGTLTVGKATVQVTAKDTNRVYGDANPVFTAIYSGFVNGQTFATSGITGSPSLTTSAAPVSNIGTYSINASLGTLSSNNYGFAFTNGTLTVNKALLTVKADDKVIFAGDALPTLTGTITGIKNGDVANFSYTCPTFSSTAGTYPIIVIKGTFPKASNYDTTIKNGTLYVNPKGPGAKKLRPYLDCVQELTNPPSPNRKYIAHFFCENTNATPVYVPIGPDNKLSSTGSFDGSNQPVLFMPGTTAFFVPFDGTKLIWELRTYETNKKTSVAGEGSSTSGRCSFLRAAEVTTFEQKLPEPGQFSVYPNPTTGRITLEGVQPGEEKGLHLFDATGRSYSVKITKASAGRTIELDLTSLKTGIYFVQLKTISGTKTVRIVKNEP